jgi:hypothetical protein
VLVATTVETAISYAADTSAAGAISPNVLELVLDGARPALIGYLKTLSLAVVVALAIVLLWPSRGFSAKLPWFGSDGINSSLSGAVNSNSSGGINSNSSAPAGGCH